MPVHILLGGFPLLITISILFPVVVAALMCFLFLRRAKPVEGMLLCVREVKAVAVLGFLLWGCACAMLLYCYAVPGGVYKTDAGASEVGFFLLICIVLGAVSVLSYYMKRVVITSEQITAIGILGGQTTILWNAVVRLQLSGGGRIMLLDKGGAQLTVGGNTKHLRSFARLAEQYLRPGIGTDVLQKFKQSLKMD